MIRTLIVEDEENSSIYLKNLLGQFCPNILLIGVATTVNEAVSLIRNSQPDLVLMDVELNGEISFQIFESIPVPLNFEVIFTTGYQNYAIQAIKYSCLDYLLKPIDSKELVLALQKFDQKKKVYITQKQIELLLQNSNGSADRFNKIAIPFNDGLVLLNISDIILCKAEANYTWIHSIQGDKILSSKNLQSFNEILPEEMFFRCHKSSLINIHHVKKYSKSDGYKVYLTGGHWVEISTRKKEEFLGKILKV